MKVRVCAKGMLYERGVHTDEGGGGGGGGIMRGRAYE